MYKCMSQTVTCSFFQARLFDEPQLASLCLENIDKNTGDALAAEGFTDIDLGNFSTLSLEVVISLNAICFYVLYSSPLIFTSPSFRHTGGSVGEGHSRGEGGASVWSCGALGRG